MVAGDVSVRAILAEVVLLDFVEKVMGAVVIEIIMVGNIVLLFIFWLM
jgi:hypothetical protein